MLPHNRGFCNGCVTKWCFHLTVHQSKKYHLISNCSIIIAEHNQFNCVFEMLCIYIVFSIKGNLSTTMFTSKLPVKKQYSVFTNREVSLQNPLLSSSTKQSAAGLWLQILLEEQNTLFRLLRSLYKISCIPVWVFRVRNNVLDPATRRKCFTAVIRLLWISLRERLLFVFEFQHPAYSMNATSRIPKYRALSVCISWWKMGEWGYVVLHTVCATV